MEFPEIDEDSGEQSVLANFNLGEAERMIQKITDALEKTQVDLTSIAKYREKEVQLAERMKELDEITQQRDQEKDRCEALKKKRHDEFMSGFNIILMRLKEMYQVCQYNILWSCIINVNPTHLSCIFRQLLLAVTQSWNLLTLQIHLVKVLCLV